MPDHTRDSNGFDRPSHGEHGDPGGPEGEGCVGGMQLDDEQREAVNVRRNAVVTAGAGSGKTRVLAERYLRLVLDERVPVDRILTLTFTRKAAAEMYERIYRRLGEHRDEPFAAAQIAQFETAQISTLDSFCARIARNGCTRFGVPPGFRSDEEEIDRLAEDAALAFLLEHRTNPVLARFIAINGFDSVWRAGLAELARSYVLVSRERSAAEGLSAQLAELGRLYRERRREVQTTVAEILALEGSVKAIRTAQAALRDVELEEGWEPQTAAGPPAGMAELEQALAGVGKRTGRSSAEAVVRYKDAVDGLKEAARELRALVSTFAARDELRELYRLVDVFAEQVRAEKRRRALLSYRDVMEMAVDLLRTDASLRAHYRERFSFIMIDEFQDNDELQKQLLYLLSISDDAEARRGGDGTVHTLSAADLDESKLFFVGDEKQSIYRFRGADVSVFKALSGELTGAGGKSLELPYNYRSRRSLLSFFNAVFAAALGGAEADYEARFAPLDPPPGGRATGGRGPDDRGPDDRGTDRSAAEGISEPRVRIAWKPYDETAAEGSTAVVTPEGGSTAAGQQPAEDLLHRDEAEAYYVARSIRDAIRDGTWRAREEAGGERPAGYDDVAILMRSTSNQRHYERMLRLFNVPYTTQSVRSLFESAPAYDVYHVLQLCVHPEDRAAYAAVLRSPFVNVSDDALVRLLLAGRPPFTPEAAAGLGATDAARYRRGVELFGAISSRVDEEPVSRIIADLWYRYGYRYRLLAKPSLHPYLEHFDHLYELARSMDHLPAAMFVEAVRDHLGVYGRRRELEVVRDEQRGVQLLSIHKAKGLEFPVVVLANTGNTGRNSGLGAQPFYLSERFGLTASMPGADSRLSAGQRVNYFYVEGERENDARELAELKRLLYVALTRAESHLLVTGVFHEKNRNRSDHLLNQLIGAAGLDPDAPAGRTRVGEAAVETELIPDVPRSATFRPATARRGTDPEAVLAGYRGAPLIERSAPRREVTVTELAERLEGGGAPAADLRRPSPEQQWVELPAVACEELLQEQDLFDFFGSLTHHLIELMLQSGQQVSAGAPVTPPSPEIRELPAGLRREAHRRRLGEEDYRRLLECAGEPAARFLASSFASRLVSMRIETEVPFVLHRSVAGRDLLVRGQIDVLAEADDEAEDDGAED
ncbi:MAG: UvrD-helicase domain-containing protein, partial [Spirochaetaceae bacterium]